MINDYISISILLKLLNSKLCLPIGFCILTATCATHSHTSVFSCEHLLYVEQKAI